MTDFAFLYREDMWSCLFLSEDGWVHEYARLQYKIESASTVAPTMPTGP